MIFVYLYHIYDQYWINLKFISKMNTKLRLEKIEESINYFDRDFKFFKGNGEEFDFNELFEKGLITEDEYPIDIRGFKKLGLGFSSEIIRCYDDPDRPVFYKLDGKDKSITIDCDNFSIKECFIAMDIVKKHLETIGAGQFVSFGNSTDDIHTLYHEEGTVYGVWWEEFYKLFVKRLKGKNKLSEIQIFTNDYQTDDERYYTKDRVINIVLF